MRVELTREQQALKQAAAAAIGAAEGARELREHLRWTTDPGAKDRERRIAAALDDLDAAMKPVRSAIGRLVWEPQPDEVDAALRAASAAVGRQRKQLKKMRR